MDYTLIIYISFGLLLYALFSNRLSHSILTAPMLFSAFGLLLFYNTQVMHLELSHHAIHLLAEITLLLVLFTDASKIDVTLLKSKKGAIPFRLLLINLPLTIGVGYLVATWLFKGQFHWIDCAVLAAILAPTDPALSQAVMHHKMVPERIRQSINIESGLNDGIVLPLIIFFISCIQIETLASEFWIVFVLKQILLSPALGLLFGFLGAKALCHGYHKGWLTTAYLDIGLIALAFLVYGINQALGANGFIAVFFAGLSISCFAKELICRVEEFAGSEGELLMLMTFLIFGAVLLPMSLDILTWKIVLFSALMLTVVRVIPVSLSLIGAKLDWQTHLFLGWFGPKGLASILFGLIIVEKSIMVHKHELMQVIVLTVALSIILHGITAYPLSVLYGKFQRQ